MSTFTITLAGDATPVEINMPGSVSATAAAASASAAASSESLARLYAISDTDAAITGAVSTSDRGARYEANRAATQAALATTNGAAQVTLAAAQVALAEDEATAAAASAALAETRVLAAQDRRYAGSAQFPFENGWSADPQDNAEIEVTGFAAGMSETDSPIAWADGSAVLIKYDPPRELLVHHNHQEAIFSNRKGTGLQRRTFQLFFTGDGGAERGKFRFVIGGDTGLSEWEMESRQFTEAEAGPYLVFADYSGTQGSLRVWDQSTAAWIETTPVDPPVGWTPATSLSSPFIIGGEPTGEGFPATTYNQLSRQCRGALADLFCCNAALTKAEALSIFNGADPVTVATDAGATTYFHVPLHDGEGNIDTSTINTTESGMALVARGTLRHGPSIGAQGATDYLTLDRLAFPFHMDVEYKKHGAIVPFAGTIGAQRGPMQMRVVREDGSVAQDWHEIVYTVTIGRWAATAYVIESYGLLQLQFRLSDAPELIAVSHIQCQIGPVIDLWSQSEGAYATRENAATFPGGLTGLYAPLVGRTDTIVFTRWRENPPANGTGSEPTSDMSGMIMSKHVPDLLGEGCAVIANLLRKRSPRSFRIREHIVSGSDPYALMNDGREWRNWANEVQLAELSPNRDAEGKYISTAHIIIGWDAFWGNGSATNIIERAFVPLFTGEESNPLADASITAIGDAGISQADIDHWIDRDFSASARRGFIPPNRLLLTTSSRTNDDGDVEADQRDDFRNWAHRFGYVVCPETTAHRLNADDSTTATSADTHPRSSNWEGGIEVAAQLVDAALVCTDELSYAPVFFETVAEGSAANKVVVALGPPRLFPGKGLAKNAVGYSTAEPDDVFTPNSMQLHVKVAGGDPGARWEARRKPSGGSFGDWSVANVTSGTIISPRRVELTLAWDLASGDEVELRHVSGTGGSYPTATISQEAWRHGALYWSGSALDAAPASVDDLDQLGFLVAGSNQALSLVVA